MAKYRVAMAPTVARQGAVHDIDGDGDLDIATSSDHDCNHHIALVWWENRIDRSTLSQGNILPTRSTVLWKCEEWSLNNLSYNGNPYDLIATVIFTHDKSDEKRITEMYYDGGTTWKFRFTGTRTGSWKFSTKCDGSDGTSIDPELHGHTGSITVSDNPNSNIKGFVTSKNNRFARMIGNGKIEGYVFNTWMNYHP